MSNITNTERVAGALFSWVSCEDPIPEISRPDDRWYTHPASEDFIGVPAREGKAQVLAGTHPTSAHWPDFTDERLAPYWCDRMQRELAARGLFSKYAEALADVIPSNECKPKGIFENTYDLTVFVGMALGIYATPAQRLEAAVRVITEVGL